jgi:hypothetical protein
MEGNRLNLETAIERKTSCSRYVLQKKFLNLVVTLRVMRDDKNFLGA